MQTTGDLTSFEEIRFFVDSLPPPESGKVRVFRGQSKDRGTLVPSSFRSPDGAKSRAIWRAHAHHLAEGIWRDSPEQQHLPHYASDPWKISEQPAKGVPQNQVADVQLIWVQAIIQHYGPGAPYLDVSTSLEMAIWFATHRFQSAPCPESIPEQYAGGAWSSYSDPCMDGHLYVIDAVRWQPGESLMPGMVVDLLDAPAVFHSERIKRQAGCLIYASEDEPDLLKLSPSLLVASKRINLNHPLPAQPNYHHVFPGPERDLWYQRVLSAPFVLRTEVEPSGAKTFLQHSLPVTIYVPDETSSTQLASCLNALSIPLLYPAFRSVINTKKYLTLLPHCTEEIILNTLPILLEGPLIYSTPPVELNMWHEGLLAGDRAITVPLWEGGEATQSVNLTNLFVEFSPLEYDRWHQNEPFEIPRALWVMDDQTQLVVTLFVERKHFDGLNSGIVTIGPVRICVSAWDDPSQFLWQAQPGAEWELSSEYPRFNKILYVVLEMLRQLAPWPKPAAIPFVMIKKEVGEAFVVLGTRALCTLHRSNSPDLPSHLLVRLAGTVEPYLGQFSDILNSKCRMGLVLIEEADVSSYPQLNATALRKQVALQDALGYPDPA